MFEVVCSPTSLQCNSCVSSFQRQNRPKETVNSETRLCRGRGMQHRERGRPPSERRNGWDRRETHSPGSNTDSPPSTIWLISLNIVLCIYVCIGELNILLISVKRWAWRRMYRQLIAAAGPCRWTMRRFSWLWRSHSESEIMRGRRRKQPFRRETGPRQRLRGCK